MKAIEDYKWLFMDMNSYFASVEQQENPNLRGHPVAVLPAQSDYTCVIAASHEAKIYGIRTGTKVKDAKKMCPNLVCVMAQHNRYVEYHKKIIEEVIRHAPINKIWSIDELSCRIPPSKRTLADSKKIAQNIKLGLQHNVGLHIKCSIGIAPNSLLAKIAAEMQKPDGFRSITSENITHIFSTLPMRHVPGIGVNMQQRLHEKGICGIKDFLCLTPKQARKIWGSVEGERLWYMLRGYDISSAQTKTVMVGHSRVLDRIQRSPDNAFIMARRLLVKASLRMRRKEFLAQKIFLSIRSQNGQRYAAEHTILPADNAFELLCVLNGLWKEIMFEFLQNKETEIKKISVVLHDLTIKGLITDDIFIASDIRTRDFLDKQERLIHALCALQNRYRKDVVSIGVNPKTSSGFVGTKIAFSRVPDIQEFWE